MRGKSASDLEREWKGRGWYRRPSQESAKRPHPLDDLNLRLRRALSWLGRAEKEYGAGDLDAAFIFYWVAFNATYGRRSSSSSEETRDRESRQVYFDRVVEFVDADSVIYDTIWANLLHPIRAMLENKFVFEPYWGYRNGAKKHKDWKKKLEEARRDAEEAIKGRKNQGCSS